MYVCMPHVRHKLGQAQSPRSLFDDDDDADDEDDEDDDGVCLYEQGATVV